MDSRTPWAPQLRAMKNTSVACRVMMHMVEGNGNRWFGARRHDLNATDGFILTAYFATGTARCAKPRQAEGIDLGDGVIVRYNEAQKELVGLTILRIRDRMERLLKKEDG